MSNEKATAAKQPRPPISIDPQYIVRITGVLLAICIVVALLLGVVNQVAKPRIDAIEKAKKEAAMSQVLPADEYVPWEAKLYKNVSGLYLANVNGSGTGWVVETTASGSQGPITMMVGVGLDGAVTGVSIVSHSETPNIGTKVVNDQSVLDRFTGMSHEGGEITVNSGSNRFDGVSGATVSSRGVTAGVNTALEMIADLYSVQGGLRQ